MSNQRLFISKKLPYIFTDKKCIYFINFNLITVVFRLLNKKYESKHKTFMF